MSQSQSTDKLGEPVVVHPNAKTVQASRRELVASLLGVVGLAALTGCAAEMADASDESLAQLQEALSGNIIGYYADTAAELRGLAGGSVGWVASLLGRNARGDGGGGVYYWDSVSAVDNGGTILNYNAANSGGWRKLAWRSAALNVKDFGAKGDGSNDDTAAIQAAANAVPGNGGTLYFPSGTYIVNATSGITFTYKNRLTIRGDGAIIKRASTAFSRLATLTNCADVLVTGLSFDLNAFQGVTGQWGGLFCDNCQRVRIENCSWFDLAFDDSTPDHHAAVLKNSSDVWFSKNYVERAKLEFISTVGATITDNTFNLAEGKHAIGVVAVDAVTQTFSDYLIARNVIYDPEVSGIAVGVESSSGTKSFKRIHIVDNSIVFKTRSGQNGILVLAGSPSVVATFDEIVVQGNTVHYDGVPQQVGSAIRMYTQAVTQSFYNSRVENNQVVGFRTDEGQALPAYAIDLQFFVRGVVRNNRVVPLASGTLGTRGLYLHDMQECDIGANSVTLASGAGTGFRFDASRGANRFEGNRVIGTPTTPYNIVAGSGDMISKRRLTARQSVSGTTLAGHSSVEFGVTVTGAGVGDTAVVQPEGSPGSAVTWSAYVAAGNTVTVRLANPLSTSVNTSTLYWRAVVESWS